ncbi:MAG TPA: hypothetical protein VGY99_21330 [Candidatus Binataceae bacterium]|jgi:hypothetical protein|nr:hypothetical protein [Candidatus Binataceae bacterium]
MFSVIFEVHHPKQEKFDLYIDLAKGLKPTPGKDGFIDNERFESTRPAGLDPVAFKLGATRNL